MLKDVCSHDVLVDLEQNTVTVVESSDSSKQRDGRRDKFKAFGKNLLDEFARQGLVTFMKSQMEWALTLTWKSG